MNAPEKAQKSRPVTPSERREGVKPSFEEASFTASVRDMRFTASGDVLLSLVVPYADKHLAVPVSDAYGMQLDVQVTRKRRRRGSGGYVG